MFETFRNRLEISGTLTTVTALRISAGRSTDPLSVDLPIIKDVLNRPLIPGASFKGALRSRLESLIRAVDPKLARDPSSLTDQDMNDQVRTIKEANKANDEQLTRALLQLQCTDLVSYVFGAPWLAGKLQISDLSVLPDFWFGQYQERNGVAIDRDTETASNGKLYEFQVVPAGTPFRFYAVLENAENWELGLVLLGLNQFKNRQIALGGGRSRGLGEVELHIEKMLWNDVRSTDSNDIDREKVLDYIRQIATSTTQPLPGEEIATNETLHQTWGTALITKLRHSAPAQ
ncbi:MAG: CRISPR-associated RAMP protein Csx7 [Stenomitos frigidus ULC029]